MAGRVGITPDFETSKWQLEKQYKNPRNWQITPPFKDKKEAKQWEKETSEKKNVKTVSSKMDMTRIRIEWRGFYFEHDGPK